MIDPTNDELLSLCEAAKLVPSNRGEHVDESTLRRWARVGLHGVKLEIVRHRLGARTSEAMLRRFSESVTAALAGLPPQRKQQQPASSAKRRQKPKPSNRHEPPAASDLPE